MNIPIFFSDSTKNYYCTKSMICSLCNKDIEETWFILKILWAKKGEKSLSNLKTLCKCCFMQDKSRSDTMEYRFVQVGNLPKDAIPFFIRPPSFINCSPGTFVDYNPLGESPIKDRTILSGRNSIEGAEIGDKSFLDHQPNLSRNLREIEADAILNFHKNALQYQEKERIDYDR